MTLLALETATDTCGVALLRDGAIVAETHLYRPRVHSEKLTPLIEDALARADLNASDLEVIAVSMGPGSYTGLRIGVSTAKGWALAADADLVGVPTLEAYAERVRPYVEHGDVVCPLLDARRDEVYAGAFRRTNDVMEEHAETKALTVDVIAEWIEPVDGHLWLLGDGAQKSRAALDAVGTEQTVLAPEEVPPSASAVARRGRVRIAESGPVDRRTFEPVYVKEVHATPAPSPFA